jgi:hypothetical protein
MRWWEFLLLALGITLILSADAMARLICQVFGWPYPA